MSGWIELKRRAREWHRVLLARTGGDPTATALLDAAAQITGVKRIPLPAGDSLLMGAEAVFDRDANVILYDRDVDPGMAAFYQMHEYAHHQLHGGTRCCCLEDLDAEAPEAETPLGVARVETYNPRAQTEREANVFAREVLLPSDVLRRSFLEEGVKASEIAARVGVPEGMAHHQISFALLAGDLAEGTDGAASTGAKPDLDDSQKIAAGWEGGPLLVEAGPGTGKTRALVGRIEYLLGKGVAPSSILALTFSNKAAEEMRSRVALAAPDAAPRIWMGTFHAFGLELLRGYGSRIGINPDYSVLDPMDSVLLLEDLLPSLNLDHYRNLYDPAIPLPDILSAISRAKDELVGPAEYLTLAEKMRAVAGTEEETLAAEKALEVARVYGSYQAHIEKSSLLDFGDLIFRSVILLREHPEVREDLRRAYAHVLVDEYQDVNRASGILLKEIAGACLWVVGDTRQSVYRFRGAAPINVKLFPEDFPGAQTKPLEVNYRSRPAIVNVFSTLAQDMRATEGRDFTPWKTYRNDRPGTALLAVAEDLDSEVDDIAGEINRLNAEGVPFRKQAVLCRSHTTMARIATRLEGAGIPVLYLGDLFEREEIRDLLSLVLLACDGTGRGLVRVARFPEYDIPPADVQALFDAADEQDVPFPRALGLAKDAQGISEKGRGGLALLAAHLEGICYGTTAWGMLVQYLFNRSRYLQPLLENGSLDARQKCLAIHQFLQFSHGQRGRTPVRKDDPKKTFLGYIRKLEIRGEEKVLRQVPEWAAGLNAVRLLTVHASKGLEFDAVFVPCLGQGMFPASPRWTPCPPPAGMLPSETEDGRHAEEEECLFFVALSRAREYLCLSRATCYGGRNSSQPSILTKVAGQLSGLPAGATRRMPPPSPVAPSAASSPLPAIVFNAKDLEIYMDCPKKYFYEQVLFLGRGREDLGYVQFHRCVYKVLHWMRDERSKGNPFDEKAAASRLAEVWTDAGPREHPYEAIYRESAEVMVSLAVLQATQAGKPLPIPEWEVPLRYGRVRIAPDFLDEAPGSSGGPLEVLRFRTGRPTKTDLDKPIYALYQAAAEKALGGRGRVKVFYLSTGEAKDVSLRSSTRDSRVGKFDEAMSGILAARFSPKPNDRNCPRCPHYFICPAPEGA